MELLNINTYNSIIIDDEINYEFHNSSSVIIDYTYTTKTFDHNIIYYLVDMNYVESIEKLNIIDNISFIKFDPKKIITKIYDKK